MPKKPKTRRQLQAELRELKMLLEYREQESSRLRRVREELNSSIEDLKSQLSFTKRLLENLTSSRSPIRQTLVRNEGERISRQVNEEQHL